jgi:ornithine carbamoyltransferase
MPNKTMNDGQFQKILMTVDDMTEAELKKLLTHANEVKMSRYQTEDTPKGENVPGVNH